MQNNVILSVKNLSKSFSNKLKVIDNISFDLKEGEILGLIGLNGSGKTTIFQILLGILVPDSGNVLYFGKNLFKFRQDIIENIAFSSSYISFPENLTILQNLNIYTNLYGTDNKIVNDRINEYLYFLDLENYKDYKISALSSGQLSKLLLVKAFMLDVKIILLDEPTVFLDLIAIDKVINFIKKEHKERNLSIIFSSHNMAEISRLCKRALVIDQGRLIDNILIENINVDLDKYFLNLIIK